MHAIIHYNGQRRTAFILGWMIRWNEVHIEVAIDGYKVTKEIHVSHIVKIVAAN